MSILEGILQIIAFINLIGWMIYIAIVIMVQSKGIKLTFVCSNCGTQFTKTTKMIENVPFKGVNGQLVYQLECPNCHQIKWLSPLEQGIQKQQQQSKYNHQLWQNAFVIAIIPAILALIFPVVLLGYAPLLLILIILKELKKKN